MFPTGVFRNPEATASVNSLLGRFLAEERPPQQTIGSKQPPTASGTASEASVQADTRGLRRPESALPTLG
jgi:hypothetical protein